MKKTTLRKLSMIAMASALATPITAPPIFTSSPSLRNSKRKRRSLGKSKSKLNKEIAQRRLASTEKV